MGAGGPQGGKVKEECEDLTVIHDRLSANERLSLQPLKLERQLLGPHSSSTSAFKMEEDVAAAH